jgi:hypothetical protein
MLCRIRQPGLLLDPVQGVRFGAGSVGLDWDPYHRMQELAALSAAAPLAALAAAQLASLDRALTGSAEPSTRFSATLPEGSETEQPRARGADCRFVAVPALLAVVLLRADRRGEREQDRAGGGRPRVPPVRSNAGHPGQFRRHPCRRATTSPSDLAPPQAHNSTHASSNPHQWLVVLPLRVVSRRTA